MSEHYTRGAKLKMRLWSQALQSREEPEVEELVRLARADKFIKSISHGPNVLV